MKKYITRATLAVILVASSTMMVSAQSIKGTWKRPSTGTIVKFSGSGKYCGTVQNGKFKGKSIGCMSGKDPNYTGSITDLEKKKTYKGKAKVTGNSMKLEGCALGGLVCRGETWKRQ